jgi:hypothetical protein
VEEDGVVIRARTAGTTRTANAIGTLAASFAFAFIVAVVVFVGTTNDDDDITPLVAMDNVLALAPA